MLTFFILLFLTAAIAFGTLETYSRVIAEDWDYDEFQSIK